MIPKPASACPTTALHVLKATVSSSTPVVPVTGAKKGIGFAPAHNLCQQFLGDVVLTAQELDIDDLQSICALPDFLRQEYRGLDVLVNNAGVAFKSTWISDHENKLFGTRNVCMEFLPLIKPQGRVVNVSSRKSFVALEDCSPELQEKFRRDAITEDELVGLMNKSVEDTKNGVHRKEGWPDTAYGVTKTGVTVLSQIHAGKLNEQRRGDKILLNACCPGWVRTDVAGPEAPRTLEEGAETPVYLALLPSDAKEPHGHFVFEKKVKQW
ncbi:carbonyl reductase [NADPH] 1-like [Camelus bactrianus]|uniref:Carbonyl reductase [NADPH] 1-like n=1 Tax=Camelus bactrianus TaxID=9837 RepID=A0AC58R557_CAMBA